MAGDQMDGDNQEPEGGKELPGSEQVTALTPAERKRLSARRRFLAGGAASLPLIMSVSRKAFADDGWDWEDGGGMKDKKSGAGRSLCVTVAVKVKKDKGKKSGTKTGKKGKDKTKDKGKKTFVSLVCKSKSKKI